MKFEPIPPKALHSVWPKIRTGLERIIIHSSEGWIPEDIYAALRNGRASLYMAFDGERYVGFYVLEIIEAPHTGSQYLNVWAAFADGVIGNHADALQFTDETLAEWDRIARQHRINRIRIHGRRGWERVLKNKFTVKHVVFERTIQ